MSSSSRTTSKGGKGAKADKSHKSDGGKGGGDKVHNKETSSKNEELSIKEMVNKLMEMTHRSEEEVCLALHESDNDITMAINKLYEELSTGEWETRDKKKKKRQASAGKQDKKPEEGTPEDEWNDSGPQSGGNNPGTGDVKERGGARGNKNTGPPRLHGRNSEGRGWRGRDRDQNEDGGGRGGDRRGGRGRDGATRGGGGRGRGGGRAGGRYPPRGNRTGGRSDGGGYNRQPIETWDNSNTWDNSTAAAAAATNHNTNEDWDDCHTDEWSTEEFSLVETKVFTPSVPPNMDIIEPIQQSTLDQSLSGVQDATTYSQQLGQSYNQTVQISPQSPVPPMVGALTPAQTQYFSQLSQQNSDSMANQYSSAAYQAQAYDKSGVQQVYGNSTSQQVYTPSTQVYSNTSQSYSNTAQTYNTAAQSYANAQNYGTSPSNNVYSNSGYQTVNSYGTGQESQPSSQQPTRTKTQRARVPPPSKIPASAVEMPGDLNSNMTYLDVQFGAMDLIDNSFESAAAADAKYGSGTNNSGTVDNVPTTPSSGLDLSASTSINQSASLETYSSSKSGTQSSISSALSQGLSNTDNIPQTSEHLGYNSAASTRNTSQGTGPSTSVPSVTTPSGLELNKQQSDSHSYSSQAPTYNSYQPKANAYSSSPYSTTQSTTSSYVSPATNYVNNQASAYSTQSANSYPNNYSSTAAAYQNASAANVAYPSVTQSNSYQGGQSYPQNAGQSVYGANAGLSNSSNYGGANASQYNSYSSTTSNHKLAKENSYDASVSAVSSAPSTTTSNAASTASLSLSQTTISSSKTTATLAKNSNSVVSNIPPGVTPVMSTPYIMGQVPYFQQTVYSYEDMQMLQQRLPHMTTPYYDMGYQTPTTLAAVRGDPTGGLGAYSTMSADARFAAAAARGDGNTSPVPSSTLAAAAVQSQASTLTAQQGHQGQPILAAGTAPPYFFATAFNTIAAAPNYAQFGAMYTQLPAATNAHGSNTSSQYGPKPGTYGSATYSAYDALGQAAQDYAKGGYTVGGAAAAAAAAAQQAQKGQGNSTTGGTAGNDLSAMYGKSHAALGKVNSYEKQGFHSGTPPPFTGALHGSQNAGLAPSGTGYVPPVYIPTMPPQHHSTAMMHQPIHQMDVRHQGRRADSGNSTGQRSQGSNQAKAGSKQAYQPSYWNPN